MSASDWTRMQRRKAGTNYASMVGGNAPTNKDISPPESAQVPYGQALLIPKDGYGSPKIVRPASEWTNYVGSQVADYKLYSSGSGGATETALNQNAITTNVVRICKACQGIAPTNLRTAGKIGVCNKCAITHVRLA